MVRFLIVLACRPAGRPSSTRYSRDNQERITRNADPGRRTELLVPTKRAAITLISHSIGGDAIVVVICLVDMHRVTVGVGLGIVVRSSSSFRVDVAKYTLAAHRGCCITRCVFENSSVVIFIRFT